MTIFLPCRAGSERVPHKNTKPFSEIEGGLIFLKLRELIKLEEVDEILLSTNDQDVIDVAESFNNSKIKIDIRPEHLANSTTSTDDLIKYVPSIVSDDHVLWTHVTSPFINSEVYSEAIKQYFEIINKGYDSLMSVNSIQSFLWTKTGSLNYDRSIEKWPRTQTISKVFEVNSGLFINSINNYKMYNDRIGKTPFLYEMNHDVSFDIDWPEDFYLAELMYQSKMKNI
jgi:CMP-N-acetylneuraminic acid synthetase